MQNTAAMSGTGANVKKYHYKTYQFAEKDDFKLEEKVTAES